MTEKEQHPDPKTARSGDLIKYWAQKGLSPRSIAAKCGVTFDDFAALLAYTKNGMRPFQLIYDSARAHYESTRLDIRDEILFDPETSKGLKAKILRDDLKEFEEHAPASRAIKIQTAEGASVFSFESLSTEEQDQIKAAHKTDDTEEDNPQNG